MNETLTKDFAADTENLRSDLLCYESEPLFDKNGKPTAKTLEAFYETEHGIYDVMTLEEFKEELDEMCSSI